jgi:hypothetical protein
MSKKQTLRKNATSGQPSQGNHANTCHGHTNLRHAVLVNDNSHNTMRTLTKLLIVFSTMAHTLLGSAAEDGSVATQGKTSASGSGLTSVFLVDDQTGEELEKLHGIHPLSSADLEVLINGVLKGGTPVHLLHQAVDEDATDNVTAQMDFRTYAGGHPPTPPSANLPLRQLAEKMKSYRDDRAAWQKGIFDYRKRLIGEVEGFVRQVTTTQTAVAQRFDEMLSARNGRDFNRSDIVGCIVAGNRLLGTEGRRIVVLNTDAEDLPAKRKPRKTPLKPEELDAHVELIFVNTSHIPDASPLFKGLPNTKHHANTMREAMELVVKMINPAAQDQPEAGDSERHESAERGHAE